MATVLEKSLTETASIERDIPASSRQTRSLHIVFNSIDGSGWTGGNHYLSNIINALRTLTDLDAVRPRISLLSWSDEITNSYKSVHQHLDAVYQFQWPQTPPQTRMTRLLRRAKRTVGIQDSVAENPLGRFLREKDAAVVFSMGTDMHMFHPLFRVPVLGWLYDFQHLHLPEMFTQAELDERNRLFRDCSEHADLVMLSSQHALGDYERFAPNASNKGRVLSFVAQVATDVWECDPRWVCSKYHVPERFFYLPNQFWKHKNHSVVLEALKLLRARGRHVTVVCTGLPWDHRSPSFFANMLAEISEHDLRDDFIVLGLVPRADTFQLLRQSVAVLQPSRFEGWSTTVEEVKAIGKYVIASDFPVHREQNPPRALFFDPLNPEELAECLWDAQKQILPGPNEDLEEVARSERVDRIKAFALNFLNLAGETADMAQT